MATTDSTTRSSTTSISSNPLSPMSIRPSTSYRAQSQLYQNQVTQQQEAQRQADEQARLDQAKAQEEYRREQDLLYQKQRQQQLDEASRMGWATYVGPGGYALGTNFSDINRPSGTIYLGGQGEYSNLYKPGTVLNVTRNTNSEVDYSQFQSKPTNISIAKQPFLEQPTRITTQQNQMDYSQFQSKPKPQYLEIPNPKNMVSLTIEKPINYYQLGFGIFKAQSQIEELKKYNEPGYKGIITQGKSILKGFGTKISELSSDAFKVEALPTSIKTGEQTNKDFSTSKSLLFKESVIPFALPQIKLFMPSTYTSIKGIEAREKVKDVLLEKEYTSKGIIESINKQREAGIRLEQENILYNMGFKSLSAQQSKIDLNPKTLEEYNKAVVESIKISKQYDYLQNKAKQSYNNYQSLINLEEKDLNKKYGVIINTNKENIKTYESPILNTKILSPYVITQLGLKTKEDNLTYKNIALGTAYTISEAGKTYLGSVALGAIGFFDKPTRLIKSISDISPKAKYTLLFGGVSLLGYGGVKSIASGYEEGKSFNQPKLEATRAGLQYVTELYGGYKGAELGTSAYYNKLTQDIVEGKYTYQVPSEKVGKPFNSNKDFYKTVQETKFVTNLPLTDEKAISSIKIKSFYDIESKRAASKLYGKTSVIGFNEEKVYPILGKSIEQDKQIKSLLIFETDKSIFKQEFLTLRNEPLELSRVSYNSKMMNFPTFEIQSVGKNDLLIYGTKKPMTIGEDVIKTNIFLERTKQLGVTEQFARGYKPFNKIAKKEFTKLKFESNTQTPIFGLNLFEKTNYRLPKSTAITGIPYSLTEINSGKRFYSVIEKELKGKEGFTFFSSESDIKTKNPFISNFYSKDFSPKPKNIYLNEFSKTSKKNSIFKKETSTSKPLTTSIKPTTNNYKQNNKEDVDFFRLINKLQKQEQIKESNDYIDYITSINQQELGKFSIQKQVSEIYSNRLSLNKQLSSNLGLFRIEKGNNKNLLVPKINKLRYDSNIKNKIAPTQKTYINYKTTQTIKPIQQSYLLPKQESISSNKLRNSQLKIPSLNQINILESSPVKPQNIRIKTPTFSFSNNIPIRGMGFSPNKKRGVGSEFEYPPRGRLKNRKYRYVADLESYFKGYSKSINIPRASKRTYGYLELRPLPKQRGINSKFGRETFGF